MSVLEEFQNSVQELESFLPLVLQMADKDGPPMWLKLKNSSGVTVSSLPVGSKSNNEQWAAKLPHMVKGVGEYPLSLPSLYRFLVKQDFQFRQQLDPLIQIWEIPSFMPNNQNHQLYLYHANFKPPTKFVDPRDFVWLGQTYLLDKNNKEIDLPGGDRLEDFISDNEDLVHRVILLNRSVSEEEISGSIHNKKFLMDKKTVRGFIRCIATVIDKIDDKSCKSQILCDMDPGGFIPEWLKGIIAQHNATSFIKLKTYLEKHGPNLTVAVK